jgi:hypothetical protein
MQTSHSRRTLTCLLRSISCIIERRSEKTTVVADSGSENVNGEVDDLLKDEAPTRVLAQVVLWNRRLSRR